MDDVKNTEQQPSAAPQPEAPKTEEKAPAETASPAAETPKAEEKAPASKYTQKPLFMEKPTQCASCSKAIKRRLWYYRSGQYFCNKQCWKTAMDKKKQEAAAKAAESAQPQA